MQLRFFALLGFSAGMIAGPSVAWGQGTQNTPAVVAAIEETKALFDDKKFNSRQRAMRQLWANYGQSRETVEELAKNGDPEIANRARWILDRWEIGMMPELPESIQRKLVAAQGRPALAMSALLDGGYLREAVEVARHQSSHGSEDQRRQISMILISRYPAIVLQGQVDQQMDLVIELLDLSAEQTPLVIARALLLEKLGHTIDSDNVLPACARGWASDRRDEVTAVVFAVLGNFDAACEVATRAQRADLLSTILLLDGRWKALAECARDSTLTEMPVEVSIDQYAVWLMATKEAGELDECLKVAETIHAAADRNPIRWRALAAAGHYEKAIALAQSMDLPAAAEMLAIRQDLVGAFQVLGVDPLNPQADLQRLIAEARTTVASEDTSAMDSSNSAEPLAHVLAAIRMLNSIGRSELVAGALKSVADLPDAAGSRSYARREAAMMALQLSMEAIVPDLVAGEEELFEGDLSRHLGYVLANRSPSFFSNLGVSVGEVDPSSSTADRVHAVIELLEGRLPQGWNRNDDLNLLYEKMTFDGGDMDTRLERLRANGNIKLRLGSRKKTYQIGDFFAKLGRSDLAEKVYGEAALSGDVPSVLRYADVLISSGQAEAAERWYAAAYEDLLANWTSGSFGFQEPYYAPDPTALAALFGQATALQRIGKLESAEQIFSALKLMPFNPVGDFGRDYLDRLATFNQLDAQVEVATYHLRYEAFARTSQRNFYGQAMSHSIRLEKHDPQAAALWSRIAFLGTIHSANLYSGSFYLTIPAHWHAVEAVAAAKRGESDKALASMQQSLDYFPMNITMGEEELLQIREAGSVAVADQIADAIFQTGLEYLQKFPLDAGTSNNVAWLAAIHDRHLDQAIELSQHAVMLVPDSTSYRDTLAEILYRRGNSAAAEAVERQCLWDNPDQWHLHEQISKFQQAARSTAPAAAPLQSP